LHSCSIWDIILASVENHTLAYITSHMCTIGYTNLGLNLEANVWVRTRRNLGPLYTRSQGQCSTQTQHSYWCKSWNQLQGLYTRSQGFNLPPSY
jgi:hypothetical protein